MLIVFFSSCVQDEIVAPTPSVEEIIVSNSGILTGSFTLTDFPLEKVLSVENSNNRILDKQLGESPANAMVPLLFDENGMLYTSKKYNSSKKQDDEDITRYITDLQTFRNVTGLIVANEKYSRCLPDENGNPVWIFDPYVKFFRERLDTSLNEEFVSNNPTLRSSTDEIDQTLFQKGNIFFIRWSGITTVSFYTGHTGGIVESPPICATSIGAYMQATQIVEAVDPTHGVIKRYMSSNGSDVWNSSARVSRYVLWYNGATSSQRNSIASYMNQQVNKPYAFNSGKYTTNEWYCSKLQWRAYLQVLSIDIDADGGDYVFPDDIKNSSLLTRISL
ncbi:MAG: hypothetical protein LBD11_08220 [Candidatus Peribacteria bacterium]|nr:hypothetical protein [Candidatus Peribacteria bacterium]